MSQSNDAIAILEHDEKSNHLMKRFDEIAKEKGMTGKEYDEARESLLYLLILNNPEALKAMSDETYNQIREAQKEEA